MSEVMTIRVDRKTKSRIEKPANAMDRTESLAAEAIRAYIRFERASEEEVRVVMGKWRRGAGKVA